jgi:hypothetical protein
MICEVEVLICETCSGALGISPSRVLRPGLKRVQMDFHFLNAHFAKGRKNEVGVCPATSFLRRRLTENPVFEENSSIGPIWNFIKGQFDVGTHSVFEEAGRGVNDRILYGESDAIGMGIRPLRVRVVQASRNITGRRGGVSVVSTQRTCLLPTRRICRAYSAQKARESGWPIALVRNPLTFSELTDSVTPNLCSRWANLRWSWRPFRRFLGIRVAHGFLHTLSISVSLSGQRPENLTTGH